MAKLFYALEEPYVCKEAKKKRFVALRMEEDLFQELMHKAEHNGTALSTVIREICKEKLTDDTLC